MAILSIELCSIVAEWLCIVPHANPKNPGPKKGTPGDVYLGDALNVIMVNMYGLLAVGDIVCIPV